MEYSIISYNVNGIRSAASKGLLEWLGTANPDIICFQELKALPTDLTPELHSPDGYTSYWFPMFTFLQDPAVKIGKDSRKSSWRTFTLTSQN